MPVTQQPIIKFHVQEPFVFKERKKLKHTILSLFSREKRTLRSLDFIFCSDQFLLKINQDFLNHDDLTDIITFDLSDSKSEIKGEIYISIERVKENAHKYNVPFSEEIKRVVFHGCLHLCGYKDKSYADIKIMRSKEAQYLRINDK